MREWRGSHGCYFVFAFVISLEWRVLVRKIYAMAASGQMQYDYKQREDNLREHKFKTSQCFLPELHGKLATASFCYAFALIGAISKPWTPRLVLIFSAVFRTAHAILPPSTQ